MFQSRSSRFPISWSLFATCASSFSLSESLCAGRGGLEGTWFELSRAEQCLTCLENHAIVYFKELVDE